MTNAPAISIIIPLYNAEKFIGEALESLLKQTFQNFEVIVVNDCSIDKSVEVVENYIPKFNGRLKLFGMEKNSGRPSLPRNKGLLLSRGEYVFFMDNDDAITPTALDELYTLAKKYTAEVVYCEHYYSADINLKNLQVTDVQRKIFVDKPTFETHSLPERVNKVMDYMFVAMPWSYMVKRQLLIKNEIIFPDIIRDDSIWTWNVVFCAEKFLRVPNAVYIWRNFESSITRTEKTSEQVITFWLNSVILGTKTLHETLMRLESFRNNTQLYFNILQYFVKDSFSHLLKASSQVNPSAFYEIVRKEFSKNLGEQDILVPLLCSIINEQQKSAKK